jgi:hypothetical protein
MYKIIGADKKEYGPITADQIRQWIRESRLNAQSQAQAEGETAWRALGTFQEFANDLGTGAPPMHPPLSSAPRVLGSGAGPGSGPGLAPISREAAQQAVNGPAVGLMVTAILGFVVVAIRLVFSLAGLAGIDFGLQQIQDARIQQMFGRLSSTLGIFECIIGAIVGVVVLMGAMKMKSLRNYSFAFAASILAMVPCVSPCCWVGLPIGIWALVVLNRPEIKSSFVE